MNLSELPDDTELAAALGCKPETVQLGALRGYLPGLKFGRGWVFPREAVLEALNRQARLQAEVRAKGKAPDPAGISVGQPQAAGRTKREPPKLPDLTNIQAPGAAPE